MLKKYVVNDELYKSYALKICKCNDLKNDIVNDMYLKLHDLLLKDPHKTFSNRFIFLTIRSIFIGTLRKKSEVLMDIIPDIQEEDDVLDQRLVIDNILNDMKFYDREILLKTHEKSLRRISEETGIHYVTLHNEKHKALKKLKKKWEGRK